MLFDNKEEKRHRKHKAENRRNLGSMFYKFVFFAGAALALKGVKGWLRSKRRK